MAIIGFIVFGLFVGFLARLLIPGRQAIGVKMTLLMGVLGSLVGGVVATALGTGEYTELNVIGSLVAIAASVFFVLVADKLGLGRRGM
jgi:uncharacterized membrane protein YeaQ/YmgE (transglycosylase-associated protein family)